MTDKIPSFIDSPFSSKVEYEAAVRQTPPERAAAFDAASRSLSSARISAMLPPPVLHPCALNAAFRARARRGRRDPSNTMPQRSSTVPTGCSAPAAATLVYRALSAPDGAKERFAPIRDRLLTGKQQLSDDCLSRLLSHNSVDGDGCNDADAEFASEQVCGPLSMPDRDDESGETPRSIGAENSDGAAMSQCLICLEDSPRDTTLGCLGGNNASCTARFHRKCLAEYCSHGVMPWGTPPKKKKKK